MKKYIEVEEIKKDIPFVNFAITTKEVDAKNIDDLKEAFSNSEFTLSNLTSNNQIHSDIVHKVKKSDINKRREGDALITNLKNVPILVFTADCVPVAIIDKKLKVIAVVHAGWKGTYAEIVKKTVYEMQKKYNSSVENLVCIIGLCIGECCYEVSEDLYNKFKDKFPNTNHDLYKIKNNKYYLNLQNINKYSLESLNIKSQNIIILDICTNCNCDKFHSYRAHDKTPYRIGTILEIKY